MLGVSKDATQEEVSKAYKKADMQCQHYINPDYLEAAEEKMKEINEANDILYDKEKRRMYDQFGHAGVDPSYQGGGGGNPFGVFHYASGDMDFNIGD
ncbi:MAG: DnaJ domain-containing protein, partial [Oscillospiraceae bacterium]